MLYGFWELLFISLVGIGLIVIYFGNICVCKVCEGVYEDICLV